LLDLIHNDVSLDAIRVGYVAASFRVVSDSGMLEESPGNTGQECWLTARRREPMESAAENIPPMVSTETQVRLKRQVKSLPQSW